jgi:type III pantothenate kinase
MIYVVDIGNTNLTIGIIENGSVIRNWRLSTNSRQTSDEYGILVHQLLQNASITPDNIQSSVISCVVPPVLDTFRSALAGVFHHEPFIIQPGIRLNMRIRYNRPQDVGADRIVNASAGKSLFGFPLIIIDSGTATTFCVLDKEGDYRGGVIFPGIHAISESLFKSTALLPRVAFKNPLKVIGDSTIASIQSGLFFGYQDMIKGFLRRIREELGEDAPAIATGGLAEFIFSDTSIFKIIDPDLTLRGLDILFRLNRSDSQEGYIWENG